MRITTKRFIVLLLALLSFSFSARAQQAGAALANPLGGNLIASTTNCSVAQSCVWMKLPANSGTISLTIIGTFSETIIAEQSSDGGITFSTVATYTTAQTAVVFPVAGMTDFRLRCSTFSSGSAAVNLQASQAGGTVGGASAGGAVTTSQVNIPGTTDPCQNSSILKSSVAINISTATTTQLVAPSGITGVYVCGFSFTISQVATTANTLQFITGTGATCGGATVTNTGLYGAGGVTAAAPIHIGSGNGETVFSAASASGVCAVTAIGATGNFSGILWYVRQ